MSIFELSDIGLEFCKACVANVQRDPGRTGSVSVVRTGEACQRHGDAPSASRDMPGVPADYLVFFNEAHAAARKYGLTLVWSDTQGALFVRRDPNAARPEFQLARNQHASCVASNARVSDDGFALVDVAVSLRSGKDLSGTVKLERRPDGEFVMLDWIGEDPRPMLRAARTDEATAVLAAITSAAQSAATAISR